ncbi:MAG TPA: RNA polymerase sigma factor [Solirubrobacterales bacterium]|jgi:RNA polymerase sigma factor (sigma-70 family)|nr:RNA polymerase sigma factor [Solirubrobacterales bacterium]
MSGVAATGVLTPGTSRSADGALAAIYREFHQPLYRFCLAIVGNQQDAEEALQNTMVKVLRALPGEQREIALKPWLYRIAHNESIDLLRRRRENVSLEATEPRAGEELAAQVETRERLRHLIADLSLLPGRQRETLLMREAGGLGFDEIGAALETSAAVARQTLYEARLGLRQMDAGREMKCETVTKALSDGDGRVLRRRDIRAHLRDCGECRRFAEEIDSRRTSLAAISPLPAAAAGALLQGLIGGGSVGGAAAGAGGAAAGGAGGLAGGAAVKSLGTATLLKGAATVAVVAAIGVGGADRGGLIHLGGDSGSKPPAAAETKRLEPEAEPGAPSSAGSDRAHATSIDSALPRDAAKSDLDDARAAAKQSSDDPEAVVDPVPPPADSGAGRVATSPGKSGVDHPSGRGHAKQTPPAASHGQETAAGHQPEKAQGPNSSGRSESASGAGRSAEAPAAAKPEAKPPGGKPPK